MIAFIYTFIFILQIYSQCIQLTHSKCGSSFSNLQVSESIFPNVSIFDKTVDRFIRGTDSVSLLKDYIGCEWDPRVSSRYPHTFFCHLIARQDKSVGECSSDASYPTLCASTCSKWIHSLSIIFENKAVCPTTNARKVAYRKILLAKWTEFCSESSFVSSDADCMSHTNGEGSFCGFGTLNAAVKFCISSKSDACCNDPSIQQRISHVPQINSTPSAKNSTLTNNSNDTEAESAHDTNDNNNNNESTDKSTTCNFADWNCSVPLKVTLIVCVICIPAIIAILYWKKRLEDNAQHEYTVTIPTKDDEMTNEYVKYLEPKSKVEHVYYPKSKEKIRHFKTYSNQSLNLENGFTIYQCMFDHLATRQGEIELKKGDQVVLKNIESDGYALGVNLNSGLEGLVLLTALKTYYHTDDDDDDAQQDEYED